ncbi:MAG: tetratricopeptide repeat protein [Rubrivivax sp.]
MRHSPRLQISRLMLVLLTSGSALDSVWAAPIADDIRAMLARGDTTAALARAEQAAAAAPNEPEPRFLKAVVLMQSGQDDAALALFTKLTQQFPELPDPYNNIALLQARAGRLELAREALLQALRNDPGHRAARANLAQVYGMLAVQEWTAAAQADPSDPELARRLAAAAQALLIPGP